MGVVGCTSTNAQANNTKRHGNGIVGYDSPKKTHMCVQTERDKEGLRRVGMGSDGCRGMHWHPANAKQDKQRQR